MLPRLIDFCLPEGWSELHLSLPEPQLGQQRSTTLECGGQRLEVVLGSELQGPTGVLSPSGSLGTSLETVLPSKA